MNEQQMLRNFSRVANAYNFGLGSKIGKKITSTVGKVFRKYGDDAAKAVSKYGDDVGNIAYKRPSNVKIDFRDWRNLLTAEDDRAIEKIFKEATPDFVGAGRYDAPPFVFDRRKIPIEASKDWIEKASATKEWQDFLLKKAREHASGARLDSKSLNQKFLELLRKEGCPDKLIQKEFERLLGEGERVSLKKLASGKNLSEAERRELNNLFEVLPQDLRKFYPKLPPINVSDISKYIAKEGLKFRKAAKVEKIKVEKLAKQGERVQTVLADGTKEFSHDLANAGDYIVQNINGPEHWVIKKNVFEKKYLPTDIPQEALNRLRLSKEEVLKQLKDGTLALDEVFPSMSDLTKTAFTKGGPMNATKVTEDIIFQPPMWGGEEMTLKKGGYILQDPTNPKDIYGVAEDVFLRTYKFIN